MFNLKNSSWIYILSFLFIALNAVFIALESYYFVLIPVVLLILILAVFSFDKLIWLTVFLVPFSVPLRFIRPDLGFDVHLPTELLLFGIMVLFILKQAITGKFDPKISNHPVSLAIYINLFWLFITSLTSTMPIVSMKFFLARLWYVLVFYFLLTQLFKKRKNIVNFFWVYLIPLSIVIIYILVRHAGYGLYNQQASHWVPRPFFNDHTSYGAVLAMFIPGIAGMFYLYKDQGKTRIIIGFIMVLFSMALLFSYTRAAWVSLAGAIGVWAVIKLKIKFKYIAVFATAILIVFLSFRTEIFIYLKENRQASSTDLKEHVKSIANIATDASNLERINRWSSALRMFEEKPFFGFGPGTYMFKYAPFQRSYEKTIISTNLATLGGAHSEYFGPLAESGILGMLSFLLIIGVTIYTALRVYRFSDNKYVRIIVLSCLTGLITYYIHGFLNNFLDTDKASAPFWGFTAIIVTLDVYYRKKQQGEKENEAA